MIPVITLAGIFCLTSYVQDTSEGRTMICQTCGIVQYTGWTEVGA